MFKYLLQVYQNSADDIITGAGFGTIAAGILDASILIPAAVALLAPILKDLVTNVFIPYLRNRYNITSEDDIKTDEDK